MQRVHPVYYYYMRFTQLYTYIAHIFVQFSTDVKMENSAYFEGSRTAITDWKHANVVDEERLVELNLDGSHRGITHVALCGRLLQGLVKDILDEVEGRRYEVKVGVFGWC